MDLVIAATSSNLLEGLRALSALGNFRIAGEGQSAEETFQLIVLHQPQALVLEADLLEIDATLPDRCRLSCPELKIILLEGTLDLFHTLAPVDALVRRTSSLAALARVIGSPG